MDKCNKSTKVLPEFEANTLYYELKSDRMSAFLGEDLEMSAEFGLIFLKQVNAHILVRWKGL